MEMDEPSSCSKKKQHAENTGSHLRRLLVREVVCDDRLIRYLAVTFTQLEHLFLEFVDEDKIGATTILKRISIDTSVKFLNYLYRKVEKYYVHNMLFKNT
jgi:hypothetical protein